MARVLSEEEIETALHALPEWRVAAGKLTVEFEFLDFRTAFSFISNIALEAEAQNHHPAWCNAYNKVSFAFCTHDVGDKITDLDMQMAQFIDQAARQFEGKPV